MQSLFAAYDETLGVPPLVASCISFLRTYGMEREGLFRVATNQLTYNKAKTRMRKDSFNKAQGVDYKPTLVIGEMKPVFEEADYDSDGEEMFLSDIDDVAAVLKCFLLDLEEPVITFAAYEHIFAATLSLETCTINPSRWRITVNRAVQNMPLEHRNTLFFILDFLYDVSLNSEVNKMTLNNLGVVFGPAFMRAPDELSRTDMDPMKMIAEAKIIQKAAMLIIEEFAHTTDEEEALPTPPLHMEMANIQQSKPFGHHDPTPVEVPQADELPSSTIPIEYTTSFADYNTMASMRMPSIPMVSRVGTTGPDDDVPLERYSSMDNIELDEKDRPIRKTSLVLMRIKKFNKAEQHLSSPVDHYISPNNRLLKPTTASLNSRIPSKVSREKEKQEILKLAELSKRRQTA